MRMYFVTGKEDQKKKNQQEDVLNETNLLKKKR